MKNLSTSALSKELGISSKELFEKLNDLKLIYKKDDQWHLTERGIKVGGQKISNNKYGDYIAWPETFDPFEEEDNVKQFNGLLNATKLGEIFDLSNQRINLVLAEIGWIERGIKGWKITDLGKKVGGIQKEHQRSGGTFVLWPEKIKNDITLLRSIKQDSSPIIEVKKDSVQTTQQPDIFEEFRTKFPPKLRTKDGHVVRSRAEVIIDNALYDYGLAHAYERKLPIEENVYSDFYIPSKNGGKAVYLEYWGLENDEKYQQRKKVKLDIYKKYNLNLIELEDKHIENLDDYLPKFLLKFDINVE